jgi:predicted nucleotidyltransferase component of viral defense system
MNQKPYRSTNAFRTGVEAEVKAVAANSPGRSADQVRRQFLLQRFLVRVFAQSDSDWVLKGGTGLLVRIPGARHSGDIDLLYPYHEALLAEAVSELRRIAAKAPAGDYLRFDIADPQLRTGQDLDHVVAQLKVIPYLGAAEYGGWFPIDLSLNQRTVELVERIRPTPIVPLPGSDPLPEFVLYPLPDQIADKFCAMYCTYGSGRPSSRFRDLVDLALIVTTQPVDAARTVQALRAEAARRGIELPSELTSPGPQWRAGYQRIASDTILPPHLQVLDTALLLVGRCLEPLLAGEISDGTWDAELIYWQVEDPSDLSLAVQTDGGW